MKPSPLVLIALAASSLAAAQPAVTPKPGDTVAPYVVQPGDTLEAITQRFLGDASLWPENQRLNPGVKDPHMLKIGSTLRIITARVPASRSAEVILVSKRVEEKPVTADWRPTREGNRLREKEGLRTGKDSSSALQFDDGTRMNLGEDSLVFLREATSTLAGRKKQSLEVMAGQADLKSRVPGSAPRSDVQVVVGGATLRPMPGTSGEGAVRARRGEGGDASVMVFGGEAQVEAAGAQVRVPVGMGTTVPKQGPPKPPQKLLAPPVLESPKPDESFSYANPNFSWGRVAGASTYTLEVCADPQCERLVARVAGLAEPRHRIAKLPAGAFYWRAMGVTAARLDGFPPAPSRVVIANARIDAGPPTLAPSIQGFTVSDAANSNCTTPNSLVALNARDDASGVAEVRYRWNAGEWKSNPEGPVPIPLVPGPQLLEYQATDRLGQTSRIGSMRLNVGAVTCCPQQVVCGGAPTLR